MVSPSSQGRRIFAGMLRLAGGTMLSRLAGFALILVIGYYYGARRSADIFWMAFSIANLFRQVVGERALESAFLPTFKGLLSRGQHREAWRLASSAFHLLLIGSAALAVLLALAAPWIVRVMAYGYSPAERELTVSLARVLMPFLVFISLAAFLGALLLAFGRFTWYGAAPAVFGIGSIVGIVALHPLLAPRGHEVYALALGAILGGLLEVVVQVPPVFSRKVKEQTEPRYELIVDTAMPELRQVGWLLVPILFSAGIEKVGTVVDRALASGLEEGSVSALTYALRLTGLPFALVGLAIGRSVLPMLSEQAATEKLDEFRHGTVLSLKLSVLLLVPVTAATVALREPLVEALFRRGEFTAEGVRLTALALWCYGVGMLPMAWVSNLSRCFHALRDTRTPLVAGAIGLAVNVTLNFVLVRTVLRVGGLALATSISMVVTAALMLWLLGRTLRRRGEPFAFAAQEWKWWAGAIVLTGIALGATYAARWAVFDGVAAGGFGRACVRFALPAAAGLLASGAVAWGLGLVQDVLGLSRRDEAHS